MHVSYHMLHVKAQQPDVVETHYGSLSLSLYPNAIETHRSLCIRVFSYNRFYLKYYNLFSLMDLGRFPTIRNTCGMDRCNGENISSI